MTRTQAPSTRLPTNTDHGTSTRRSPSVLRVIGRCAIAAVGMVACAMSPALLEYIPGFSQWMTSLEAQPLSLPLIAASFVVVAFPLIAAAVVLPIVLRLTGLSWRQVLGGRSAGFSVTALFAATAAAAVVTACVIGVLALAGVDADRAADAGAAGVPVAAVIAIGLARAFLMQGIQEELWFRGFAFVGSENRPWLILGATTLAFTSLHLMSTGGQQSAAETFLYLVLPLGMGFWAGVERLCTGSVWPAIGIHGGMHTGMIVTALAGWPMGPAAWVGVGLAFIIAAAFRLAIRLAANGQRLPLLQAP